MMHYRVDVAVARRYVQARWSNTDRQANTRAAIEENQILVVLSEALGFYTRTQFDYLSGTLSPEYVSQQKHAACLRRGHIKAQDYWLHASMTGCFDN